MSPWIVNASVAAKWFYPEDFTAEARRVMAAEESLHAPDFFLLEMDNFFCKRIRRGEIAMPEADDARKVLRQLPVQLYSSAGLEDAAFALANQTRRSVYDCLYLALALLLDGRLVTADRRLFDSLGGGVFSNHVLWIEEV